MAHDIDRAAAAIQAELASDDPTLRDLAKSQRALARMALAKARGADPANAEDEDEIDAQQTDDHDEWDAEEDEDQDPDNPDLGSGVDDLRGVVGSRKKGRTAKSRRDDDPDDDDVRMERSRRRQAVERAEDDLVRAKIRLRKAERAEQEADADGDDERLEEARKAKQAAARALNRARGTLQRARPAWAGDEADFDEEERGRRRTAQEWYAEGNDAYFTNEDADHQEDEIVPPDGPAVADGDDTDQYTIGAHKVRSRRAMRRSRAAVPDREQLYKSLADDGRITEELLDAAPALEALVEELGVQADALVKSQATLGRLDQLVRSLARTVIVQNRALGQLKKSVDTYAQQPQVGATPWGLPPALSVLAGGKKPTNKLQKSKQDLLLDAERGLNQGVLDATTFQSLGRLGTAEDILAAVPAPVAQQLGWR